MTLIAVTILLAFTCLWLLVKIRLQHIEIADLAIEKGSWRSKAAVAACGKDNAYRERNHLVRVLTRLYDAHLSRHPDDDKDWENDWRWIVCVHTPAGQACWHIHDSEVSSFQHLNVRPNDWDGHSTEEKYARLERLRQGHQIAN